MGEGGKSVSTNARDLLMRGMAAAKAGDRQEARFYLEWVLRTKASKEEQQEARFWLSEVSENAAERRDLLDTILAENPNHVRARRNLAIIDGKLNPAEAIDPDRLERAAAAEPQPTKADRFTCPQCGARMVFAPDGSSLYCEHCTLRQGIGRGGEQREYVPEQDFIVALATAKGHLRPVNMRVLQCKGCGVAFTLAPETLSLTCPYCDSVYVTEAASSREMIPPHGLIPFAVDQEQAQKELRGWFKGLGLERVRVTPLQGLYVPVWVFTVGGTVPYHYTVQQAHEYGGSPVRRSNEAILYEEMRVPAGRKLAERLVGELDEFDLGRLVNYDPRYLADWPAETYSVPLADASLVARRQVLAQVRRRIELDIVEDYSDLKISPANLMVDSFKLVLLPFWFIHYLLEGKRYEVIVNGQTGEVQGERPARGISGWLGRLLGN
jgi:predicted RNA-binding Zn-ribbon protein involved in translation (DUF1610 family)